MFRHNGMLPDSQPGGWRRTETCREWPRQEAVQRFHDSSQQAATDQTASPEYAEHIMNRETASSLMPGLDLGWGFYTPASRPNKFIYYHGILVD